MRAPDEYRIDDSGEERAPLGERPGSPHRLKVRSERHNVLAPPAVSRRIFRSFIDGRGS